MCNNENKWAITTDITWINLIDNVKWKKGAQKKYMLCDFIYVNFKIQ